jgi:adenylate cyclase
LLEPIILVDALQDEKFSTSQSIVDMNLRTIMAAPLRCEDDLLGLIYVDSKRPLTRYSKHHLNVLSSLADQAAVALRNARKFETHTG